MCMSCGLNEEREFGITIKAYLTVEACCEEMAGTKDDLDLSKIDDWEIWEIEEF